MQEFLSGGVRIAFIDAAPEATTAQPPILLIHGFASNHRINWVEPRWVSTLAGSGRRVIALDNRGHGGSEKLYRPEDYHSELMAADSLRLLDHLGIERADVMGYSMGARIAAFLALAHPKRVRGLILGGLGDHLVDGVGLPPEIADAMEAEDPAKLTEPMQKMFRAFADRTKSDRKALAACIRGSRQTLTRAEVAAIRLPTLIAIGTRDEVAGDGHALATMFPDATALDIPGRDHNLAVGDKVYKAGALAFLDALPAQA